MTVTHSATTHVVVGDETPQRVADADRRHGEPLNRSGAPAPARARLARRPGRSSRRAASPCERAGTGRWVRRSARAKRPPEPAGTAGPRIVRERIELRKRGIQFRTIAYIVADADRR